MDSLFTYVVELKKQREENGMDDLQLKKHKESIMNIQ